MEYIFLIILVLVTAKYKRISIRISKWFTIDAEK